MAKGIEVSGPSRRFRRNYTRQIRAWILSRPKRIKRYGVTCSRSKLQKSYISVLLYEYYMGSVVLRFRGNVQPLLTEAEGRLETRGVFDEKHKHLHLPEYASPYRPVRMPPAGVL